MNYGPPGPGALGHYWVTHLHKTMFGPHGQFFFQKVQIQIVMM